MRALSHLGSSPLRIRAVLDELPSFSLKVSMQTSLVGFTLDWLGFFAGISISNQESYFDSMSTSITGSGTQDVVAYSMVSWSRSYDFLIATHTHTHTQREREREREYSVGSWHLEQQVNVVWNLHEFCQCRMSQDGMIGILEVGRFKLDVQCPIVCIFPKFTGQTHLNKGFNCVPWNNSIEQCLARGWACVRYLAHFLQSAREEYIDPLATFSIDEYFGEFNLEPATTRSRTTRNLPSSEKLVHFRPSQEPWCMLTLTNDHFQAST